MPEQHLRLLHLGNALVRRHHVDLHAVPLSHSVQQEKVDGEAVPISSPASPSWSGHVPVGAGLVVGLTAGAAPLIFALAFGPLVPRALRVALVFTTAVTGGAPIAPPSCASIGRTRERDFCRERGAFFVARGQVRETARVFSKEKCGAGAESMGASKRS